MTLETGDRHPQEIPPRRLQGKGVAANPVDSIHVWNSPQFTPTGQSIQIVTTLPVYQTIWEQSVAALPNETGGFLLGHAGYVSGENRWHILVREPVPLIPVEADPAHFVFTWKDVERIRDHREKSGQALLGWYHTHPNLGIFLSQTDVERTHLCLFNEPFQVALVVDPVRGLAGYFHRHSPTEIDCSEQDWREFSISAEESEVA